MKKMFDFMNPLQEKRLEIVVTAIVKEFKPLQLICFASSLKTDAALSCFCPTQVNESYDYEMLVVTEPSGRKENEIQQFTTNIYKNGSITIFDIKKDDMKKAIETKNLYIVTILRSGVVLYVAEGFNPHRIE